MPMIRDRMQRSPWVTAATREMAVLDRTRLIGDTSSAPGPLGSGALPMWIDGTGFQDDGHLAYSPPGAPISRSAL